MAAYVPQHAARDANRYPAPRPTLGSEPRKLSQSAVTAITAYIPSTTSPNSDGNSAHSVQSITSKPTKKLHKTSSIFSLREKSDKASAHVPKNDAAADFTKQMLPPVIKTPKENSATDLDHPLLRKVGLLPPGAPPLPETSEEQSDYETYLDECRVTAIRTTIARQPPVKLINIEKANRLSANSSSTHLYSNHSSPKSPSAASFSSSSTAPPRRGSLMSKVADYIKPGSGSPMGSPTYATFHRRESTYSQMSFGSVSSPDPNDARSGSRRGSVMSSMSSRFCSSNHNKNRRMSSKESDTAAIEKAVIESYKNSRQHTALPVTPRIDEMPTFENFGKGHAGVRA